MGKNRELIKKFKEMADIADASYAMLHYVYENIDSIFPSKKWEEADVIMFGDKTKENDRYIDNSKIDINSNTAYARAIESRFQKDVVVKKGVFVNDKLGDSPKMVSATMELSHRTKNFVNRYELVHHIPNTLSGYSSTTFYDNFNKDYIIAFRGTEETGRDMIIADGLLALSGYATTQVIELIELKYTIFAHIKLHALSKQEALHKNYDDTTNYLASQTLDFKLTLIGHSLGGHLAQVFTLFYSNNIKELYTYNAPGVSHNKASMYFLRFVACICRLFQSNSAKLFNSNGFTRKILDKVANMIDREVNGENATNKGAGEAIAELETIKDKSDFKVLTSNIKKLRHASRNNMIEKLGLDEIHHIETSNSPDNISSYLESPISKLNIKLGIPKSKEYTDDTLLHTIMVREAGLDSHYMDCIVKALYLYEYILSYEPNNQKNNNKTIGETMLWLNTFTQTLKIHSNLYEKLYRQSAINYVDYFIDNIKCVVSHSESINNQNCIESIIYYQLKNIYPQILDKNDMGKLTIESSIAALYALYQCQFFIVVDKNGNEYIKDKEALVRMLGYKSSFVNIFCLANPHLSQTYIEARKELYKIVYNLRYYYWHYPYKLDSNGNMMENNRMDYLIFGRADVLHNIDEAIIIKQAECNKHTQDIMKSIKLELDEVYVKSNKITIFARDNSIIDSKSLEKDLGLDFSLPCDVYFYALLLRGGKEDIDNPRFFYGENEEVYMSDESDNIEVFYNNARLSMTNYYYHAYS